MPQIVATEHTSEIFGPWLYDYHWRVQQGGVTHDEQGYIPKVGLAYTFPSESAMYLTYNKYLSHTQHVQLEPAQRDVVAGVGLAFEEIDSFVDIEIAKSSARAATIQIAMDPTDEGSYAYLPAEGAWGGDIFFGTVVDAPVIGNEAYLVIMHEIGHALGLLHGHEFPEFVATGFDSQEYTVVTYTDYVGDTNTFSFDSGPVDWAQSFMQLDIAALQFLYGANYASDGEVWSGDTTYRFSPHTGEMSINGVGQGVPAGNRIFRTIWDGDGDDTYDLSNYMTDLDVSLAQGAFSTFSEAQLADLDRFSDDPERIAAGNVANALLVGGDRRALIENAIGGGGDDRILGNVADNKLSGRYGNDNLVGGFGEDTLLGHAGDDRLLGGSGKDTLNGGDGADSLYGGNYKDLVIGGAGSDLLFGENDNDEILGGDGDDQMYGQSGRDILKGGYGKDLLHGGYGVDFLYGQAGADVFRFAKASDSSVSKGLDWIMDFVSGADVIDLRGLAPGELTLAIGGKFIVDQARVITRLSDDTTVIEADIDGDRSADFKVFVMGVTSLDQGDFVL
ncbi:MAG: M10 family metallopeptidase C-terminal domain-containing protein [Paracoccaceae bacterium]